MKISAFTIDTFYTNGMMMPEITNYTLLRQINDFGKKIGYYQSAPRRGVTPHEMVVKILFNVEGSPCYFSVLIKQKRVQYLECLLDANGKELSRYCLNADKSWDFLGGDVLILGDSHSVYIENDNWRFTHYSSHRDCEVGFKQAIASGNTPKIPALALEYLDSSTLQAFTSMVSATTKYVARLREHQRTMAVTSGVSHCDII